MICKKLSTIWHADVTYVLGLLFVFSFSCKIKKEDITESSAAGAPSMKEYKVEQLFLKNGTSYEKNGIQYLQYWNGMEHMMTLPLADSLTECK